jgi:mono/diheme cytochrome c family protein
MIKVLTAGLIGTAVGIAVMVIVIVSQGTTTSDSSAIGLTLSVSTATPSSAASSAPSGSTSTTGGGGGGDATAGKAVFTGAAGCAGCHTFTAAGSSGMIGPNLDNVSADDAASGGAPLDDFIKESIVDPDKYIAKGYTAGIMPTTFGSSLSSADIANLVAFISENQTS